MRALATAPAGVVITPQLRSYYRTLTRPSLTEHSLIIAVWSFHSTMSNTPIPAISRSNLDSIFSSAFKAYKEKTGKDITSHPLAIEIQSCHSPDAILAVLRQQIPMSSQSQSTDERFTKWLIPTVNVLYAFSATIGEGVGLVNITKPSLLKICTLTSVF